MNDAAAVPADVAIALSRLNEHARSYGCGRAAIYAYKGFAALLAATFRQALVRPVALMAKCMRCDGTGRFISEYEGPTKERCRTCAASGYVHLRFAETEIAGQRWHHPWERGGLEIFCAANPGATIEYLHVTRELLISRDGAESERIGFGSVGDWTPNRRAEKLGGADAAGLLNIVEDWLLRVRVTAPELRWPLERALQQMRIYDLDLGRIGESCHYCGAADVRLAHRRIDRPLSWAAPACAACEKLSLEQWARTVPEAALTSSVIDWLMRRGCHVAGGVDITKLTIGPVIASRRDATEGAIT